MKTGVFQHIVITVPLPAQFVEEIANLDAPMRRRGDDWESRGASAGRPVGASQHAIMQCTVMARSGASFGANGSPSVSSTVARPWWYSASMAVASRTSKRFMADSPAQTLACCILGQYLQRHVDPSILQQPWTAEAPEIEGLKCCTPVALSDPTI